MRFLETVTFFGNDALVPINRIECITFRVSDTGSYEINIKGKGKYEWAEFFEDEEEAQARYAMIKKIIEAE